jgi:hypothetical protein
VVQDATSQFSWYSGPTACPPNAQAIDERFLQQMPRPVAVRPGNGVLQKAGRLQILVLGQQALQVSRESRVVRGDAREPDGPLLAGHVERLIEIGTEGAPAIGAELNHGAS